MNITYILDNFPKLSETFIIDEMVGLIQSGHNIEILSLNNPNEKVIHDDIFENSLLEKVLFLSRIKEEPFYKLTHSDVVNTIVKTDIFVSHFASKGAMLANYLNKNFSIPYIFTTHAFDLYISPEPSKIKDLIKNAEKCITISKYNKHHMLKNFGGDFRDKIAVLYNAVDIDSIKHVKRKDSGKCKFITVGRMVEKKGIISTIKGFAKAYEKNKNIFYTIIGDGPQKSEIKRTIKSLGINHRVDIIGALPRDMVKRVIVEHDAFILTSETATNGDKEGMPVAIMEAMACGLPVISTKHTGIPELVIDGKTGFLVKEKDQEAISEKIVLLATQKGLRSLLGKNSKERITNDFNLSKRNLKIERIIYNCFVELPNELKDKKKRAEKILEYLERYSRNIDLLKKELKVSNTKVNVIKKIIWKFSRPLRGIRKKFHVKLWFIRFKRALN